ncbi:hypothetical protein [Streptomyces sp. Agncl-13]|uniref:hypothetical protein n=1 Tax=Streptomyces sp. Agncl-13 TaxID=3400628 RepID=UPI003A8471E2
MKGRRFRGRLGPGGQDKSTGRQGAGGRHLHLSGEVSACAVTKHLASDEGKISATPANQGPEQPWRPGKPLPAAIDPTQPSADIRMIIREAKRAADEASLAASVGTRTSSRNGPHGNEDPMPDNK